MCLKSKITTENMSRNRSIDSFNKDFNTKLKENNMPFLLDIFKEYVREYMSDVLSESEAEELFDIEQELYNTLNKEQIKLYEKWNRLKDNYLNKMIEHSFVYGICTYKQFEKESDI